MLQRPITAFPALHIVPWLFVVLYAMTYPFSSATIDTVRDLAAGYQIASGNDFPLAGTTVKDVMHVGPFWYYLIGIVLFASNSVTLTMLTLGLLSGLKFWLAFRCGALLKDERLGLFWAAALALPGWHSISQVTVTHPNIAPTAVLLVFYCALRFYREQRGIWLALAMAAFSIALHAHVATAFAGLLIAATYLLVALRDREFHAAWILLGSLLFILPFSPYLYAQHLDGWREFRLALEYLDSDTSTSYLADLPALLYSLWITGPRLIGEYVIHDTPWVHLVWRIAVLGSGIFAAIGLMLALFSDTSRRLLLLTLAANLLFVLSVLFMRPNTPYYMVLGLQPAMALIPATGWWALWQHLRSSFPGIEFLVVAGAVTVAASTSASIISSHIAGFGRFPVGMHMHIKREPGDDIGTGIRFPLIDLERNVKLLCDAGPKISLHGDLAFIVDKTLGLGVKMHCASEPMMRLGGSDRSPGTTHIAGLAAPIWKALGKSPAAWYGTIGLIEPMMPIPLPSQEIASVDRYPPRPFVSARGQNHGWHFELAAGAHLVLTNLIPLYMKQDVITVSANGRRLQPLASNVASLVYRCDTCDAGTPVAWAVQISSPDPGWMDIFAFH